MDFENPEVPWYEEEDHEEEFGAPSRDQLEDRRRELRWPPKEASKRKWL